MPRKLSDDDVIAILLDERDNAATAGSFRVGKEYVGRIRRGDTRSRVAPAIPRGLRRLDGLSVAEILERRTLRDQKTGCLLWQGSIGSHGYGQFTKDQEAHLAHRDAFELANGPIPDGVQVLHSCDTPPCCEPTHLFLGSYQTNSDDKVAKDRHQRGSRHWAAKLTEADIPEIRRSAEPRALIAQKFGVSISVVDGIKQRKGWRHVP